MPKELSKTYDPKTFEERLYEFWESSGYFHTEVDPEKKPYVIMMPPPNVTGSLHMGHAMNNTLQDILIRWKRMNGYAAMWQPGSDHASISTEAKVVEKLKQEGKSKEEVGREGFLKEAWDWTHKYGSRIEEQLKKLGVSCDWERKRFTLDEAMTEAVEEVFIRLYEKGYVYRGDRIVNWCPSCRTAISDAEVEHEESKGFIWHIKYPIKDSEDHIVIATTRPETMLGDLAVAVHPEDERYRTMIGKKVVLPLIHREIPIIADTYVDMTFGSGAVKITPSHDPNDFEVGARHELGQCIVIKEDATIAEGYEPYSGLSRYEARKKIVEDLSAGDFLVETKEHENAVGHCERCSTVIEPLISKQWFVRMEEMARPALEAYRRGELHFIPERFGKIYAGWLENIRDWCISRQLWWGHRLPVYHCEDCDEIVISRSTPETCKKCGKNHFKQSEDTLDTWFSSALWPFSTLGWPKETEELKYFFPTDVLVTGYDIIFFWVVRMVFSSIEQTGKLPFKDVYLTGLIRDEQGRKMSKSLGNGIDPLDIIEKYGADALRFTLVTGSTPGNDSRFSYERTEASRNFGNKLWNASRFVLMNLTEGSEPIFETEDLELEDRWILSELNRTILELGQNLEKYEVGMAAQRIHDFIWSDFCDWYIELVKPRLFGEDVESKRTAQGVLLYVLKNILKLLHPFMPFITEEIWGSLPGSAQPLIISEWAKYEAQLDDAEAVKKIEFIREAIRGIRNARAESEIAPSKRSVQIFVAPTRQMEGFILNSARYFKTLGFAESVQFTTEKENLGEGHIVVVLEGCEIYLPLKELIDFEKELERLEKEREKLEGELKRLAGKLSNAGFIEKAPPQVIEGEKAKQEKYQDMLSKVSERLHKLKASIN